MKITTVNVDIVNAAVTVGFEDGSSQVVVAPLAPEIQGVSLDDLKKVEEDVKQTETDVQADEQKIEPPVEAPHNN